MAKSKKTPKTSKPTLKAGKKRPDPTSRRSNKRLPANTETSTTELLNTDSQTVLNPNLCPNSHLKNSQPLSPLSSTINAPAQLAAPSEKPVSGLSAQLARNAALTNSGPPHVEVQALAGTGKTTTVVQGLKYARGLPVDITPSLQQQAVWDQLKQGRSGQVRVSAFNNTITDELKARLEKYELTECGCEARGIHSLGNYAVYKNFGKQEPKNWATNVLISKVLGKDVRELKQDEKMSVIIEATKELVGKCKQNLLDPTPENLDTLTSHYDVDVNGYRNEVYGLVPKVLELSKEPQGIISFDDMIWLPVIFNLPIFKVDIQIVDESQDLNRMQQELMYRAGHRIIFVGDKHQAIYGFAGADAESMEHMSKTLSATSRSCTTLPLTITRRCSRAVVDEAKRIVPQFEAHPDNPLGSIEQALYPLRRFKAERPWNETYGPLVQPGDMVLCRVNAPLVGQCFRFLKRHIKATILGRNIGDGLIALIEKSRADTIPQLTGWLDDWLAKETALEQAKRFPSEDKLVMLQDKVDCILCFCEEVSNVGKAIESIQAMFTEDVNCPGVRFSSIHKSKGLEANQVFLLQLEGACCPHPKAKGGWEYQQEMNMLYVAITRAINKLIYVS